MNVDYQLYDFFMSMYNKDKSTLKYLLESEVPVRVLVRIYDLLLLEKTIIPIEQLAEEKKKELVSECRGTGIFFTNESLIRSAKVLHTLKI